MNVHRFQQTCDKQYAELQDLGYKYRELQNDHEEMAKDLALTRENLQVQMVREGTLLSEKDSMIKQIADLTSITASIRTVSASSGRSEVCMGGLVCQSLTGMLTRRACTVCLLSYFA